MSYRFNVWEVGGGRRKRQIEQVAENGRKRPSIRLEWNQVDFRVRLGFIICDYRLNNNCVLPVAL